MSAHPPIVDTHVHVIAKEVNAYPFTPRDPSRQWHLENPVDAEGFAAQMDEQSIARAVLVQAVGAYSYDNRYVADAVRADENRFVGACCIDVEAPDAIAMLRHWIAEEGLHGVRLFAVSAGSSWLADPSTYRVWEEAGALDAHVIVTLLAHQLGELESALTAQPSIPVSLDHCGFPPLAGPPWDEAAPLFELARFEQLHLKVTTNVIDLASRNGGDPAAFVERLAAEFGADRLMWGSDYCQTHDRSYAELVALGRNAFHRLSTDDAASALGGTALRLWPALRDQRG